MCIRDRCGLGFHHESLVGAPYLREQSRGAVNRPSRPAVLLAAVAGQLGWDLTGDDQVLDKLCSPSTQVSAVGQVEVFGQRVGLPASSICDGLDTPDASGAVEVEPVTGFTAGRLLDEEVPIDSKSLQLRKPCLLYTSPSPRDATLSRMPSSA